MYSSLKRKQGSPSLEDQSESKQQETPTKKSRAINGYLSSESVKAKLAEINKINHERRLLEEKERQQQEAKERERVFDIGVVKSLNKPWYMAVASDIAEIVYTWSSPISHRMVLKPLEFALRSACRGSMYENLVKTFMDMFSYIGKMAEDFSSYVIKKIELNPFHDAVWRNPCVGRRFTPDQKIQINCTILIKAYIHYIIKYINSNRGTPVAYQHLIRQVLAPAALLTVKFWILEDLAIYNHSQALDTVVYLLYGFSGYNRDGTPQSDGQPVKECDLPTFDFIHKSVTKSGYEELDRGIFGKAIKRADDAMLKFWVKIDYRLHITEEGLNQAWEAYGLPASKYIETKQPPVMRDVLEKRHVPIFPSSTSSHQLGVSDLVGNERILDW